MSSIINLAFGDGTPKKAILTAVVIGTILTVINHGDLLLGGSFPHPLKVFLTYLMPYCVTTWGAIIGKRAKLSQVEN
ncbi:MAG: nitrate/nitrite transporter NrtS [Pseudomonadota bacterium]|mgnify:FL=1|nr:nitrate/nitrite transporter NrtS [Pseudomonadota bacterium]